jgi:hypothetical protein
MTIYNFTNPGGSTPEENLELMMVLFSCVIQGFQGRPMNPAEPFQIDDAVFNRLPIHLQKFFRSA